MIMTFSLKISLYLCSRYCNIYFNTTYIRSLSTAHRRMIWKNRTYHTVTLVNLAQFLKLKAKNFDLFLRYYYLATVQREILNYRAFSRKIQYTNVSFLFLTIMFRDCQNKPLPFMFWNYVSREKAERGV